LKRENAESRGYKILYIWESDIKNLTKNELVLYFKNMINNYENNKN